MLTKVQKKRLAREARKLAMECLTNGPQMENGWCGCAIGLSLRRARLATKRELMEYSSRGSELAVSLEAEFSGCDRVQANYLFSEVAILGKATRKRIDGEPTAVVIPLLAWADFLLEESSEQPPAGPSKET